MAYYFNLPQITQLTPDQQRAVEETNALALSGGPGTGKSVVSLWRHIMNHSTGLRNSLLLTYTKTLEFYLASSAKSQNLNAGVNVNRIYWWQTHNATNYDEIIIDEAQDVEKIKFERFFNYTNKISYGADERQSVYLKEAQLDELIEWTRTDTRFQENTSISLSRNFRNSKEILLFTRSFLPDFLIPQNAISSAQEYGFKPVLKVNLGWETEGHIESIVEIIEEFNDGTHNIAILVPFQTTVDKYYDELNERLGEEINISKYKSDDTSFNELENIHITTFKSSKGTEFDTVIIPEFDNYEWNLNNRGDIISENDYYVAFTRAKLNLYLLCKNGIPNRVDVNTIEVE